MNKYKGKEVKLEKPFRLKKGNKKFGVYVKNPDTGNVILVKFGDPNLEIKRDDPERRKSFNARHDCDNKKDKTTSGYWSCQMWRDDKSVSDMLENFWIEPFLAFDGSSKEFFYEMNYYNF